MGTQERRERQKKEIREKILKASEELFLQDGYRNISIKKVADMIEYSPAVIYAHFKDKADILLHIFRKNHVMLLEKLEKISRQRGVSPVQRLRAMGREYIRFGLDNPHFYELTFISNVLRFEICPPDNVQDSSVTRGFELLVGAVRDCAGNTEGNTDEVVVSQTLWAAVHGLTSLIINHPEFPWAAREKLIESMLGILTSALPPE